LVAREKRSVAIKDLPEDMEWLKAKVKELSEHTGLPIDEAEDKALVKDDTSDEEAR
jgi:hypothetical protein